MSGKNIFLDCGGHFGEGLLALIDKYKMDSTWIIHTFEPNPAALVKLEETVKSLPQLNITLHKGAVLDFDGVAKFSVQTNSTGAGSIDALMNSGVCADPNSISFRPHDTIINVKATDISGMVLKYSPEDTIILKLDVEGSEFRILRKLLKDGLMSRIKHLYIEWHDIYMTSETNETKTNLLNSIVSSGTNVSVWG